MTIHETLHKYLTDNGLWPKEAEAVIVNYCVDETTPSDMGRRMGDYAEDYPPQFIAVLIMALWAEAVRWIDTNKPKHIFRPMFTGELEKERQSEKTL